MGYNRYGRYKETKKIEKLQPQANIQSRPTDILVQYMPFNRLDNISAKIYGTSEYWWVILLANEYTIEFDIPDGEYIRIPYPIEDVLEEIDGQLV